MSRIFFDTNLFVYVLEGSGDRGEIVADLIHRIVLRRDQVVTSCLTLGELLVKPKSKGNLLLEDRYRAALKPPWVQVQPFDEAAAGCYAEIRQDRTIKGPDAIQLACAAAAKCDLFIKSDDSLSKKIVTGIQFITSLDRVPI